MSIPADVVSHIARLARLQFSAEESERLRQELGGMLDYFGQIAEIRTDDVEPTSHAVPMESLMRDDAVVRDEAAMGSRGDLLKLGPGSAASFFRVPRFHQG